MALLQEKQQREALRTGQIPDDVGLLPETFVMPYGKNRPSWFTNFALRWRFEKRRWKTRLPELYAYFLWRYVMVRPRPHPHPFQLTPLAKDLHHKMYSYFAAGNLDAIAPQLCPGLLGSLRSRISQRPAGTYLKWTLHEYVSKPRLVSIRSTLLPGKNETSDARNGVMQGIVRIHSLQSLQSVKKVKVLQGGLKVEREVAVDSQGREIAGAPRPDDEAASRKRAKETVEYFVLQSVLRRSKMAPWMVWGTANEVGVRELRKLEGEGKTKKKVALGAQGV